MEASLLFFIAGLAVCFSARFTSRTSKKWRFAAILSASVISCWICRILGAARLPGFFFPGWMIAIFGILAGWMVFISHEKRLFTESGLRNFATILLSLIHSGFLLGILWLVSPGFVKNHPSFPTADGLSLLLLSFLFFFGFAFPERYFKKKNSPEHR